MGLVNYIRGKRAFGLSSPRAEGLEQGAELTSRADRRATRRLQAFSREQAGGSKRAKAVDAYRRTLSARQIAQWPYLYEMMNKFDRGERAQMRAIIAQIREYRAWAGAPVPSRHAVEIKDPRSPLKKLKTMFAAKGHNLEVEIPRIRDFLQDENIRAWDRQSGGANGPLFDSHPRQKLAFDPKYPELVLEALLDHERIRG